MDKEKITPILEVKDLKIAYGAIEAIKGVSFFINKGEIVSLIGANGAGKTTILHSLSGILKAKSGTATFLDLDLLKTPAHKIVAKNLVQVPEGRRIFSLMTVEENISLGAYLYNDKDKIEKDFSEIYGMFPRLYERRTQLAGTLSGGEQQMLAIGRALMTRPEILLMDEPSMGLAPILVGEIFKIIKMCNDRGMTILLVEQNANMAMKISNRTYVLETGKIVLEGDSKELLNNEDVKKAYLGN